MKAAVLTVSDGEPKDVGADPLDHLAHHRSGVLDEPVLRFKVVDDLECLFEQSDTEFRFLCLRRPVLVPVSSDAGNGESLGRWAQPS